MAPLMQHALTVLCNTRMSVPCMISKVVFSNEPFVAKFALKGPLSCMSHSMTSQMGLAARRIVAHITLEYPNSVNVHSFHSGVAASCKKVVENQVDNLNNDVNTLGF